MNCVCTKLAKAQPESWQKGRIALSKSTVILCVHDNQKTQFYNWFLHSQMQPWSMQPWTMKGSFHWQVDITMGKLLLLQFPLYNTTVLSKSYHTQAEKTGFNHAVQNAQHRQKSTLALKPRRCRGEKKTKHTALVSPKLVLHGWSVKVQEVNMKNNTQGEILFFLLPFCGGYNWKKKREKKREEKLATS